MTGQKECQKGVNKVENEVKSEKMYNHVRSAKYKNNMAKTTSLLLKRYHYTSITIIVFLEQLKAMSIGQKHNTEMLSKESYLRF